MIFVLFIGSYDFPTGVRGMYCFPPITFGAAGMNCVPPIETGFLSCPLIGTYPSGFLAGDTGMYVTFLITIGLSPAAGLNYYPPILTVSLLFLSSGFNLYG